MITPDKLAEIIQNVLCNTGQGNMPPVNVSWDKLNYYDKCHAVRIAREVLEQIPKRDRELYQDVEKLKCLAYALKRTLNEHCPEEE